MRCGLDRSRIERRGSRDCLGMRMRCRCRLVRTGIGRRLRCRDTSVRRGERRDTWPASGAHSSAAVGEMFSAGQEM